jgi:hypothetical protein
VALRRAGFLHDLGRAGVPSAIWEIYEKAGISTRAGAAPFAMEHGLIGR